MNGFILEDNGRYKPSVPNTFLLLIAGIVWFGVGTMLMVLACSWLSAAARIDIYLFSGAGILLGLLVHHFGFLRIVDKNLKRILQMEGKRCFFSFFPWKSYLIIVVMVALGALLRHSSIPKKELSTLYMGIGLALVLSSVRYIRIFFRERGIRNAP
jgi:hypothetical protein